MRAAAAALELRAGARQQIRDKLAVGRARLQLVRRKALQPQAQVLSASRRHPAHRGTAAQEAQELYPWQVSSAHRGLGAMLKGGTATAYSRLK